MSVVSKHPHLCAGLFFALLGCSGDDVTAPLSSQTPVRESAAELQKGASRDDVTDEAPVSPSDRSLPLDVYERAGMPAPGRNWNSTDLASATIMLSLMANKDMGDLPRYESRRSGDLFARIIAVENLAVFGDRSLAFEQRISEATTYIAATTQLFRIYFKAHQQGAVGGGEVVELAAAQLRIMVVLLRLVEEDLKTRDEQAPDHEDRMAGLKKMQEGVVTTVGGCLTVLTESKLYRLNDRKRLAKHLKQILPELLSRLPVESRAEIMEQLNEMVLDPHLEYMKSELVDLVTAVKEMQF